MGVFFCLLISFFSESNKIKLIDRLLGRNSFSIFELPSFLLLFLFDLFQKILFICSFYRFDCRPWVLSWRNYWVNNIIIVNLVVLFHLILFLLLYFHLFLVLLFKIILLFDIISHTILFLSLIFHFFYSNFLILLFLSSLFLKLLFLVAFYQFFIEVINFVKIMTNMIFINKLFM